MKKAFVLCLLLTPSIAAAEDSLLQRDASCAPFVTVQHQGCSAATYFRCEGDGGVIYRVEMASAGRPSMIGIYDSEYNIIAGGTPDGQVRMVSEPSATTVRLSLGDLMKSGKASYSETLALTIGATPLKMHTNGDVSVRPEAVEIDGKSFQVIDLDLSITTEPDVGKLSGQVRLFMSDTLGFPLEGETSNTVNGTTSVTATDPFKVILPGEPDFGTLSPRAGCGA